MCKIAYLPHYLSHQDLAEIQFNMLRLTSGEQGGLKLEKLFLGLYSIRLNKTDRLLLIKKNGQWIAVELVKNHDYHRARCFNRQILKNLLGFEGPASEIDLEAVPTATDESLPSNAEFTPSYLYGGIPLLLDEGQDQSLGLQLPSLVIGPPGSGKTTVSMALLQKFILQFMQQSIPQPPITKPKVIYLVPTTHLRNQLDEIWKLDNPLSKQAEVLFTTYTDLADLGTTSPISTEQFGKWLKEAMKSVKHQFNNQIKDWEQFNQKIDELRFEFSLLKVLGSEKYLKNTEFASCFPTFKELITKLYRLYLAYLEKEKLHDLHLAEIKRETDQDLLIFDEGQAYSPFQHHEIARITASNNRVFGSMDTKQCQEILVAIEIFVRQLYYQLNRTLSTTVLNNCHRCPERIVRVANRILAFGRSREPHKTSHHYKKLVSTQANPGSFRLLDLAKLDLDTETHEYIRRLCASPETLVLAFGSELRSDFVTKLPTPLRLTPAQALGFDAKNVILVNPFSGKDAKNFAKCTANNPASIKELAWLNALFIAVTRAGHELIILHDYNQHGDFSELLETLHACDDGNRQILQQSNTQMDQEKWIAQYRNALAQGYNGIADKIRESHLDIQFPEPIQVKTPSPVLASANTSQHSTIKAPGLKEKDLEAWCQGKQETLKVNLGLNKPDRLTKLLAWLASPENAKLFLKTTKKYKVLRTLLKNELNTLCSPDMKRKQCFSQFLASKLHCLALLEELLLGLTDDETKKALPKLAELEEASKTPWLFRLIDKSTKPELLKLFHALEDNAWFNSLMSKTGESYAFEEIHLDLNGLKRLAKMLNIQAKWSVLIESYRLSCRSKAASNRGLPFLMRMMLFLVQENNESFKVLQNAVMEAYTDNQDDFFVLFNLPSSNVQDEKPKQSCLMLFCLDYLLEQSKVEFLNRSLVNQCQKLPPEIKLFDALSMATDPESGVNLFQRMMVYKDVQIIFTHLALAYPNFRAALKSLCRDAERNSLENYLLQSGHYDLGSFQLLHLINHDKLIGYYPGMNHDYRLMIAWMKSQPAPEQTQQLKSLRVNHEKDSEWIESFIKKINEQWKSLMKSSPLVSQQELQGLQNELRLARQGVARLLFNQDLSQKAIRLQVLANLIGFSNLANGIVTQNHPECLIFGNESFLVINRLTLLQVNDSSAYQNSLIIDGALNLCAFVDLDENHPFKTILQSKRLPRIQVNAQINRLAVRLDTCENLLQSNPALKDFRESRNSFIDFAAGHALVRHITDQMHREPLKKQPEWIALLTAENKVLREQAVKLFLDQVQEISAFQLCTIFLSPIDKYSCVLNKMLALGAGDALIEFISRDKSIENRIKFFLLLKEGYTTQSGHPDSVWEMLTRSQEGLDLLNCLVQKLQEDPSPATSIYYDWLKAVLTPGNRDKDEGAIIQNLLFSFHLLKRSVPALKKLILAVLSQENVDWRFAMPDLKETSVVPSIYFLLQPQYRGQGYLPEMRLPKIFKTLLDCPEYLIRQFSTPEGETTSVLELMTSHRKNRELFNYIVSSQFILGSIFTAERLFNDNKEANIDPYAPQALSQSLFGKLIHHPGGCTIIYQLYQHNPDIFARLKSRLFDAFSNDNLLIDMMSKTLYSRHFMRIIGLGIKEDFFIKREVLRGYINLIASQHPQQFIAAMKNTQEGIAVRVGKALLDEFIILQKLLPISRDDQLLMDNELQDFVESLHGIEQTVRINMANTQSNQNAHLAGRILAYALARYARHFSLDFEVKLIMVAEKYIILLTPALSLAEANNPDSVESSELAYVVNDDRILSGKSIKEYLNKAIKDGAAPQTVWISCHGIHYLVPFVDRTSKMHALKPEILTSLRTIKQLLHSDPLFEGRFDPVEPPVTHSHGFFASAIRKENSTDGSSNQQGYNYG